MQPDPNPYLGMMPLPHKRRRSSETGHNAAYVETLGLAGTPIPGGYSASQYALYQPSTSNAFASPGQYSSYRQANADPAQVYQPRFGSGQIRNDFGPALDTASSPTSSAMPGFRYTHTPLQSGSRAYTSFPPFSDSTPPQGGATAPSPYRARPNVSLDQATLSAGPSSASEPRSMAHHILERHVQPLGTSQQPHASILGATAELSYPSSIPRTDTLADPLGLSLHQLPEQNALPAQYQSQARMASESAVYSGSMETGPSSAWALQNQG
ncbi:uncharacterized protein EI97DRAFT_263824 [Westerdykella ornata]|uniref:Uncharacterized protein n=1 Tax=Westerdykella ornata TaxID=318751 RepID=A0A6A6J5C3_WESOR|nr:uncharacterized protein EI97DRAFT_263824 [Westerdykella ornata]KAF2271592.1 hypothetical protein EI97DRAFT_263824 [Westerdykella ornata]